MNKHYSEMSAYELECEIGKLHEKARKAEQMGMINEYAVYERKIVMAKSYLMDPSKYHPGDVYEIEGEPGVTFTIDHMKGYFAWGTREGKVEEEGIPISLLTKKVSQKKA